MCTQTDKHWASSWYFFLGQPSEGDFDFLFQHEIVAYVLPEFILGGNC